MNHPALIFVCLACLLVPATPAAGPPVDLDGGEVELFAGSAARAIVLLFASPECPISNRLAPEVIRIHRDFAPRGVAFYLVYPELEVSADEAREHAEDYGYPFPALLDHGRELVEKAGATILSEVAVFSPAGEPLYRGRVNDRFVDFGKARPAPTRDDLREALEAILAGRPVSEPRTQAIGCFISPLERSAEE